MAALNWKAGMLAGGLGFGMALIVACQGTGDMRGGAGAMPRVEDTKVRALRANVNHIVVIFQENWSFDGLYGKFPGANGIANAGETVKQVDRTGKPYGTLPAVLDTRISGRDKTDKRIPTSQPMEPLDLGKFISANDKTGDAVHRFYDHQLQINGGKNNMFVAYSDAGGLTMTYFDATNMPEGKLAQEFTLCDNFFQGAFGGSFLNHFWLICAASPEFKDAPANMKARLDANGKVINFSPANVTEDGYAVNTLYSVYKPVKPGEAKARLVPPQTMPTIGERLSEKNISWAWYAGGWDDALAGHAPSGFEYHHQPFQYFEKYGDDTTAKTEHLRDEKVFFAALENGSLPGLSYVKPCGGDDAHPAGAALLHSQEHVAELVAAVRKSAYWKDTIIIVTYDENGGRWDHVAPPKVDRWGPGSRIPAIVIGPFARKGFVDHTQYDTTSILKLIELRWDVKPLTTRDAAADGMLGALEFSGR